MEANLYLKNADKVEVKSSTSESLLFDIQRVPEIGAEKISGQTLKGELVYTIRRGDNKRLTRDGLLRVYNLNQKIEIPVTRLLGRWKKTHVGLSIIITGKDYQVEGKQVHQKSDTSKTFLWAAVSFPKFVFSTVRRIILKNKNAYT